MKDKWMNLGCEEDELKPYVEPEQDFKEPKRIGNLINASNSLLSIKLLNVSLLTSFILKMYI